MAAIEAVNGEVLDQPTLAVLCETVEREHLAVTAALETALAHALPAGDALLIARTVVPPGEWWHWLEERGVAPRTASLYARLAKYRHHLPQRDLTIKQAQLALRGLPDVWPREMTAITLGHGEDVRDEARRLDAAGMVRSDIAKTLGVSYTTVRAWLDPSFAASRSVGTAQRRRRRKAEREALLRQEKEREIKRAVRKAGAALAEAYAVAERLQDVLGQAHREIDGRDARAALAIAGEHHRKMRDEIVRALGVV